MDINLYHLYIFYTIIVIALGILSLLIQTEDSKKVKDDDNIIIAIEGNIGGGKSTLLYILKQYIKKNNINNIFIVEEPVHIWESTGILKEFYLQKDKYAGLFQIFVLETLVEALKKTMQLCAKACSNICLKDKKNIIITERSLDSTRWVFAKMLYDNKEISDVEMNCYLHIYNTIDKKYLPSAVIYLNTDIETCNKRIIKRGREGESISKEYLANCDIYYKQMINNIKNKSPVLEIESYDNDDIDNIEDINGQICKQIIEFCQTISL